ncbi:hypothetical protein [Hymenobacter sp. CRA2]|uniref:hypothetical protein n=1 Tax=Hymenobacter sp. CRA2 TaxID=1955620 RepID=UPI00098FF0CB|nr:hypothetical protein [Hymenobacter sp. CRA2]OON68298.1 hypothetical protein B0919_14195 [Hymenobacter sp. CRA2]
MTVLSRPIGLLLLAGSLLTACDSEPKRTQVQAAPTPEPVQYPTGPDSATAVAALPKQRLLSQSVSRHVFSTARDQDLFSLQLVGDSVQRAVVRFCIISAAGDTLWREQFAATALLPTALRRAPAARQQAYMLAQFRGFLTQKQFVMPAVPPGTAPASGVEAGVWTELQQTGLPGFRYAQGDAPARRLAYLPSQRKAVAF